MNYHAARSVAVPAAVFTRLCVAAGAIVAVLLCSGSGAYAAVKAPLGAPEHLQFSGRVTYAARECLTGGGPEKPLGNARLILRSSDGRHAVAQLAPDGIFTADIDAVPPIHAFVELEDKHVFVEPAGPLATPYIVPLGMVRPDRRNALTITEVAATGAANIFATIDHAAEIAASASTVPLSQLGVTWRYKSDLKTWMGDDGPAPQYQQGVRPLSPRIQVRSRSQAFWNWDLMHEYGHYVLDKLAGTVGNKGGTSHTATQVFPDQPLIPWVEGFADGFASIVSGDPRPTRDCASLQGIDLSTIPASPLPDDQYSAQYNEIAIAGTLWRLANYFGSNVPWQGLAALLAAIHANPPQSARQFLDALLKYPPVQNATTYNNVRDIFYSEAMRWAVDVSALEYDNRYEGSAANSTLHEIVEGPYGAWSSDSAPLMGAPVPPYSDIHSFTVDGDYAGGGYVELPYKADESHLNPNSYVVKLAWTCSNVPQGLPDPSYKCTPTRTYRVTVVRFVGTLPYIEVWGDVTLTNGGGYVTVATFDGQGRCQLTIPPAPYDPSGPFGLGTGGGPPRPDGNCSA